MLEVGPISSDSLGRYVVRGLDTTLRTGTGRLEHDPKWCYNDEVEKQKILDIIVRWWYMVEREKRSKSRWRGDQAQWSAMRTAAMKNVSKRHQSTHLKPNSESVVMLIRIIPSSAGCTRGGLACHGTTRMWLGMSLTLLDCQSAAHPQPVSCSTPQPHHHLLMCRPAQENFY